MANNRKGEPPFTHWTHIENAKPEARRFHKIIEFHGDGPGVVMKEERMPGTVITHSGFGHKGEHVALFFYKDEGPRRLQHQKPNGKSPRHYYEYDIRWPTNRDFFNMILGVAVLTAWRFIALL